MRYLTACSGIEAMSVAWEPMGWEPVGFFETGKHASKLLNHYWPNVTNYGDLNEWGKQDFAEGIEMVAGGTPCQSFSVGGFMSGISDHRGELTVRFFEMVVHLNPTWVLWENVPGVLSVDEGETFGEIINLLGELGYGYAWRVLDLQDFGLPHSRKRLFLIGHIGGDQRRAALSLFEGADSEGNTEKVRAAGEIPQRQGRYSQSLAQDERFSVNKSVIQTITTKIGTRNPVQQISHCVVDNGSLRRLTENECEALMGFPRVYTDVCGIKRTPRHYLLGNSIGIPVLSWIGARIDKIHKGEIVT